MNFINQKTIDLVPEKDRKKILALLEDLDDLNKVNNTYIRLCYVNEHTEYSPERTDPCPDYYGMYYLWDGDMIGDWVDIDTLDNILYFLNEYANLCN